ncbi:MAG: hypothetical protein CMM25_00475 [Rhodospirillaceae bacterium]|nr:hypothetical protein [Rhodospirillaceae bacterium]
MIKTDIMRPNILIVGAGITGATVAAGLRKKGYSVVQLEASSESLDPARGDHLGPRVVETLQEWDILNAFMEAGAEKRLGARWYDCNGKLIMHAVTEDLPIPHKYYIVLNHDLIATTALNLALNEANYQYTLFRPMAARNIEKNQSLGGGVKQISIKGSDDRIIKIIPDMTIACDGRSSRIRKSCDFTIKKSYDYEKLFVVLFGPRGELQDTRNEVINYASEKGGVSRIPRANGQWKLGLSIDKSEVAYWKQSSQNERKKLLAERAPILSNMETEVAGFYPVIRRETDHWVSGTTVLLGDACHTIHPCRGQGMNFGIRCAQKLFNFLPKPNKMNCEHTVQNALLEYERQIKPHVDQQLEANHAIGLEMDLSKPQEDKNNLLKKIAADKDSLFKYRMTMAGYADHL